MARKETKLSAMHLTTTQEVWDYYTVVNGQPKTQVEEEEGVQAWIEPILNRYSEEDIRYVIQSQTGVIASVVFDFGYFENALETKHCKEELAKSKPQGIQMADYAMSVLVNAMTESIKEVKGEELMKWFEKEVYAKYGPVKQQVQVVSLKGEPIKGVVNKEVFDTVSQWLQLNEPVFLTGPAGTGKNTLIGQICEAYGYACYGADALKQPYELTGFNNVDGYQETQFYKACDSADKGIDTLFFLDEFDSCEADVTPVFNDAIASGVFTFPNNETKHFREHLKFVAMGNTWGTGATSEYVGRNKLDAATLNRFVFVPVDYVEEIEDNICEDPVLLRFLREFRQGIYQCGIEHIVSYRNIRQASNYFKVFGKDKIKAVLQQCLIKNLTKDDLGQITKYLSDNEYSRVIKDIAEDY